MDENDLTKEWIRKQSFGVSCKDISFLLIIKNLFIMLFNVLFYYNYDIFCWLSTTKVHHYLTQVTKNKLKTLNKLSKVIKISMEINKLYSNLPYHKLKKMKHKYINYKSKLPKMIKLTSIKGFKK